jgi:hypothetical protein
MRQQSYYYLNNKKYVSLVSNLGSLLQEITNFYQQQDRRKIILVSPDNSEVLMNSVIVSAKATVAKYNPIVTDVEVAGMFESKNFSDVDNLEYLNNDEKGFLMFFTAGDMVNVHKKYSKALLKSIGEESRINDFMTKVYKRDVLVGYDPDGEFKESVTNIADFNESYEDHAASPSSKFWSYDILFYVNDVAPNELVLAYLKEKFTIHGMKNINEQLATFIQKVTYISPLIGMLDHLEEYHGYDKLSFIATVFHQDNPVMAVYALKELWVLMENTPGFIDLLINHEDWDYYETYREYNITWPMMIKLIEQGYTDTTVEYVRNYWDQVEFLHRRKSRIPYLMHSVFPLVPPSSGGII